MAKQTNTTEQDAKLRLQLAREALTKEQAMMIAVRLTAKQDAAGHLATVDQDAKLRMQTAHEALVKEQAFLIALKLFTDYKGEVVERLVLTHQDGRDMGGWCFEAAVKQIKEALLAT